MEVIFTLSKAGGVLFAMLIASLLLAVPVFAFLDNPTSMSVESVKWFRNVAVDGDMVGIFRYKIPYGAYPATPASSTIMFRLYDTDGVTLKATNTPYVYVLFATNGYGDGVSSFYLPPGSGTWGASYKINIYGLPAFYSGLPSYVLDIAVADWSTANSTTEAQRDDLYNYVLQLSDDLKTIYTTIPLKAATDGAFTLSPYGESYFTGAIPGIYSMCPQLFFSQVYVPQKITTDNYTMALAEQYKSRLQGTDIDRGTRRIGALIGVGGQFVSGFFVIGLCVWACIYAYRKGWGIESGLLISGGIVTGAAALLGDAMFTIVMVAALVAGIAIFWILHLKRAN